MLIDARSVCGVAGLVAEGVKDVVDAPRGRIDREQLTPACGALPVTADR